MGTGTTSGPARQRHTEDLLAAVSMTSSQLAQAVGRFDGDTAAMVTAAIRTAERAFEELDACYDVIDEASATGQAIAARLSGLLAAEDEQGVGPELDALDAVSARVRGTDQARELLHRVLGREEAAERTLPVVRRLTGADLPGLPSAYADDAGFDDLMALAAREEELAPRLRAAHAERLREVAAHLVRVVEQVAAVGFTDEVFARESVHEARRAHELWVRSLAERRRDLG
ncbi:hypothetical protein [Streptomyces roseicoloratus]|uniref:Uncharacterized protein n=1 Tax=Streptomyces roseicoloratus TaxID=2508722 RepID=A0ABY9RQL9_9ACTN|nr:hypothetical protein [Streptomyces roseicoloratus]WMX44497.1 hypothetical protein RGF97_05970 [Streptomyces roseicoloratus]